MNSRGAKFNTGDLALQHVLLETLQKDAQGFKRLAAMLEESSGISLPLSSKNQCLMASRLISLLRKYGLKNYEEYFHLIRSSVPSMKEEFIQALTTNTTEFMREVKHFDFLSQYLRDIGPQLQGRELRIWCAASSTGQEPYSIAITALETLPELGSSGFRMLATDIDRDVLQKAANGVYKKTDLRGVAPHLMQKYFDRLGTAGEHYGTKDLLRSKIRYAPFNLTLGPYQFQQGFDVIFCRNVLIYFSQEMTHKVITNLCRCLRPGGMLILGHSEAGLMRVPGMKSLGHAVYIRGA